MIDLAGKYKKFAGRLINLSNCIDPTQREDKQPIFVMGDSSMKSVA